MDKWLDYTDTIDDRDHTVAGALKVLPAVVSPQLGNERDLLVYLPPSYGRSDDSYPVLYFQDGQNLFDQETSFAGEWQVDETMERMSREGVEAIIVGIPHAEEDRLIEYNPFRNSKNGLGRGRDYLDFILQTVKPLIDANFRTLAGPRFTGIVGSSMGGLISLYAFFHQRQAFGFVGAMSPSVRYAKCQIFDYVLQAPFVGGRIYLDVGTREHSQKAIWLANVAYSRRYYGSVRRMHRILVKKGYRPRKEILYVEEKWARHEEDAWARRLPGLIRFFLRPFYSSSNP